MLFLPKYITKLLNCVWFFGGHSMASGGGDREKKRERILSKNTRKSDHFVRFYSIYILDIGNVVFARCRTNTIWPSSGDRVTISRLREIAKFVQTRIHKCKSCCIAPWSPSTTICLWWDQGDSTCTLYALWWRPSLNVRAYLSIYYVVLVRV